MKLILGFLFFLVFLALVSFTMVGSSTFIPYSKDMLFTNMYPYEGFRSFKDSQEQYGSYVDNAKNPMADFTNNNEITTKNNQCSKVMGFNGLFCPTTKSADTMNPTEIFSTAKGDNSCESYGLMNSRGFLCLDDNQKKMLTTRGGNATGANM
jgi:hypothetical protein